jgi:hypothetical protein
MGALTASNFVSKMSFFSIHGIITDLKSLIFITAGRDLRKKNTNIDYLKGRIFDCALSPTFQVVTGIGYLPQVATCGYENQALRAAKMHKIILHEKKRYFENGSSTQSMHLCYVPRKRHFACSSATKRLFAVLDDAQYNNM